MGNALLEMYGNYGSIEDSLNVIDKMPHCDVVPWAAMIFGYAMQSYGREALQVSEQMQNQTKSPSLLFCWPASMQAY